MRDKIIDYYKTLISIGWMVADDEGNVSVQLGDETIPATIDSKRLILPTREQMKNTDWSNRVGFHPLRESYNLGVSDVVASLRDQFVQRLNATIGYLMKELIHISHNVEGQKDLSTDQSQVLNILEKCDDRTVKDFASLLKNTKSRNNADQFINIHIRRGGVVKGTTYGRAGIVKFPIYEQLKNTKDPVNGVRLTVKDRNMLVKLHEYIFPMLSTDLEYYSVGVSSRSAPFLESLVRSTLNVADAIVEISQVYLDKLDLPQLVHFDENLGVWKEIFDSKDMVNKLAKTIPALNSNEDGQVQDEIKEESTKPVPVKEEPVKQTTHEQPETTTRSNMTRSSTGRMVLGAPGGITPPSIITTRQDIRISNDVQESIERQRRELIQRERELMERERELSRRTRDDDRDVRRPPDARYDRDYDRRDDRRERTGDAFLDNPVLRSNLRDEESRGSYRRYDRGYDRRVPDIRDRYYDRGYDRRDDRRYGRNW